MFDNKQRQQFLLWGLIGTLLIGFGVVCGLLMRKDVVTPVQDKVVQKSLTTGSSRVNPQEIWVHDFSNRAKLTEQRLEALEEMLTKLLKFNTEKESPKPMLENAVQDLRDEMANGLNPSKEDTILPPQPESIAGLNYADPLRINFRSKDLKKVTLSLHQSRNNKPLKTTDNMIPAGTFVEATLLGGVDASTSIQASSDPRPILLRLTDAGTLPRKFKSDLMGCHVLAASFGDISSERVFMRLEKLSCVERKTGEVLEMNVQGYVAGEDGRAGIRGIVVDKAGANMRNAMVGGFFSSIGKFLGQARSPLIFSPTTGLAENNRLSTNDILKQSAGNGMSGALDKYADFYIKRAEQMQPVIQVAAGRLVDIVFTQGVEFSDSAHRQMLSKTNDQKRFQEVQTMEETKSLQSKISNGDQE